jgi:dTDP-4-dehydrorhamnose 3,5-epimerase
VLSETADVEYKCTELYDPADEFGIVWNDPELGITWPVREPILSQKDRVAPRLAELADRLPVFPS